MDFKKISKNTGRFFGWFFLVLCSLIIRVIPFRLLYGFANGIGSFGYRVLLQQRRIAQESLKIAFGRGKTAEERETIARESFLFMARSAVELMFLMDNPCLLKKRVTIVGQEYLQKALAKGCGVILVSAHFGNFPLLMAKLALSDFPISGIMRPMRDSRVERFFLDKRQRLGVKTIYSQPRTACVNETIETLRKNGIVFIPIDQNFGTGGVFVDFFGSKAATATGPVVLAQRTKAALIPCFIVRQKDDTHVLIFEEALQLRQKATPEETVQENIQQLTTIIETYIRTYPAEWGWIHRRWKSKPSVKEG
ncbi:MAG: lysophospholipid acyltransferase family protein [Candidatus Omnitrophica bacterium]|nr:lysophospholipid acyltransferase family protein [Candidatus Omnitrophota bacterium]